MVRLEKVIHRRNLPMLVEGFGKIIVHAVNDLGKISNFFATSVMWMTRKPYRIKELIQQVEFIGNQSLFIIILSGCFTGMVFAIQIYSGFHMLSAEYLIGPSVALALSRELAPVLTGLIVTGRAGAAMTAQIGTMRVTEQIDALEVMGINPKQYLVMPRILAAIIAMPMLAAVFCYVGNIGAYYVSIKLLNIDGALYLAKMNFFARPRDIAQCMIKAAFFGMIFSTVGTYKGFNTENGARGVGAATNETVVTSSILILISDYFVSALLRMFMYGGFN